MSIVIQLKNVSKSYKNNTVLNQLNMNIHQGDIYGLIGDSQSGKSTILKTILGLTPYDKGKIYVYNDLVSKNTSSLAPINALIGEPTFYPYLSGEYNLKLYADLANISHKKVQEVLTIVGLNKYKKKKVSSYTQEMLQCLAIARVFLTNPEIIFLDEFTNNLGTDSIQHMHAIIKEYAKQYLTTFVYCTKTKESIYKICNRGGFIKEGKMMKEGFIKDFEPKVTEAYEIVSFDIQKLIHILSGYAKYAQTSTNSVVVEIEKDKLKEMGAFLTFHNIDVVSLSKKNSF